MDDLWEAALNVTRLKVAVAGLGIIGGGVVEELRRNERFEIVAAADTRPEALAQLAADVGARGFTSVAALCSEGAFDVLYVCTPEDVHAEHTLLGLRSGRHVVADKPIALTAHDASRIVEESRRANRLVLCGHSHAFDVPVTRMAEIVASGELGTVRMINTWLFNNFMYRPRSPQDLDRERGGSAVFNLGPHQIDIARRIASRPVRTVRAAIGAWDQRRATDGSYSAFLGFEDGPAATLVLNGYGYFDSAELGWWIGDNGGVRARRTHPVMRSRFETLGADEASFRAGMRYGADGTRAGAFSRVEPDPDQAAYEGPTQPFFGFTVVSCERGDMRQSPRGLLVYDVDGCREIDLPAPKSARAYELDALYDSVASGKPCLRDAAWGAHTLDVVLAMYASAKDGREVVLRAGA